jgi:hypothetical protein
MHSTPHKDHVIVHEIAHQLHRGEELQIRGSSIPISGEDWEQQSRRLLKSRVIDAPDEKHINSMKKVTRQVSRYASHSPHEFVVETFTGGILGKRKYSDEVKKLYLELNGPYPEKVFGG